jgi:penicillin-binding protein 1B
LEVTQMYHTIASGGFRTPLRAIRAVLTADGHPLTRYPLSVEKVFTDEEIYLIQAIMKEVARSGTARAVYQFVPRDSAIAGKTGTSNDLRDSWFAGFSSDKLGVIRVGMDDDSTVGLTGSAGALRVWGDIMHAVGVAPNLDIMPENVGLYPIDRETYRMADRSCNDIIDLPFIKGSEPPLAPCAGGDPVPENELQPDQDSERKVENESWFKGLFR